jgi:hypothetical protein
MFGALGCKTPVLASKPNESRDFNSAARNGVRAAHFEVISTRVIDGRL